MTRCYFLAGELNELKVLSDLFLKPNLHLVVFVIEEFADCKRVFSCYNVALSGSDKSRLVGLSHIEVVIRHFLIELESLDEILA